jgi:hypothetical protein
MIDPTYFDPKTKKYFQKKSMKLSYKLYEKEFLLNELMNL